MSVFGTWVLNKGVIQVLRGNPHSQELECLRFGNNTGNYPSPGGGTHQRFWTLFYDSVPAIYPDVDTTQKVALTPINNDPTWLTAQRNKINYQSYEAVKIAEEFAASFNATGFPNSLPGILGTQWKVAEGMIDTAMKFCRDFMLLTDSFHGLGFDSANNLQSLVRDEIFHSKGHSLVRKTIKNRLVKT